MEGLGRALETGALAPKLRHMLGSVLPYVVRTFPASYYYPHSPLRSPVLPGLRRTEIDDISCRFAACPHSAANPSARGISSLSILFSAGAAILHFLCFDRSNTPIVLDFTAASSVPFDLLDLLALFDCFIRPDTPHSTSDLRPLTSDRLRPFQLLPSPT